jgi:MerR family copper efflux transcriptional regulator
LAFALAFDKKFVKKLDAGAAYDTSFVESKAMHIRDLTARTGIAERQVRYLIAEGFLPPPRGGRARADYDEEHVAAIERYRRLRDLGFPPAAIKLLLQAREGAPFPVAPGITLVVDPDMLASGARVESLVERVRAILTDLLREPNHAGDAAAEDD